MSDAPSLNPSMQEWIRGRANAVRAKYTGFQCLHEHGHGEYLVDEDTPVSIFCPFHPNVETMAARYYPSDGRYPDKVRCFGSCHSNFDSINMYMKFRGLDFMEALRELERRFGIQVAAKPETAVGLPEVVDRSSSKYVSEAWADVPRVLDMLEARLARLRSSASLTDYVKFCRVLDAVRHDLEKSKGVQSQGMVDILARLRDRMDSCRGPEEILS